jgi:voltage-gated potassium channel
MTAAAAPVLRHHGNPYNIFILVLTVMSLGIMALLILPLDPAVRHILTFYDNVACGIFLIDFLYNLTGAKPKRAYFFKGGGWLDLLGSIPSFGVLPWTGLFRLARLGRLARIGRLLRGKQRTALIKDIVDNRGQYAAFVTLLLVFLVLSISSVLVLVFETGADGANIATGQDALWWSFVTITTVGYGDRFPVTLLGRATGVGVMFAGIGIIGALASILASMLVAPSAADKEEEAAADQAQADKEAVIKADLADTRAELARTRTEMAELRRLLASTRAAPPGAIGTDPGEP